MTITRSHRFSALFVLLVTLSLMFAVDLQIARTPQIPIFDQEFIHYTFDRGYPKFSSGITSLLLAGTVNQWLSTNSPRALDPDLISVNTAMRIVAASLYLGAGGLLAWAAVRRNRVMGSVLFLLFLLTSRYPFLWLSSELFAGAFLMFYLWSMLTRQPFIWRAILLALFAFTKPDLLLPAMVIGFYEVISEMDEQGNTVIRLSALRLVTFAIILSAPLLPGFILNGVLSETGARERSLLSFSQHYAALVESHQIVPAPEPWANARKYVTGTFGSVTSVVDVILAKPSTYMDFVFLSMAKSLRNSITSYIFFLLPLVLLYWQSVRPKKLQMITLLLLANLVPILLLSFLHVRYMARFYPVVLLIIFVGIFQDPAHLKAQHRFRYAAYGYMVLLLVVQIYVALDIFQQGYWFRD